MIIKKSISYCAALLLLFGGGRAAQAQTTYSVSGRIDDTEAEGRKVYLRIYDTNERIDSSVVEDGQFRMDGTTQVPYFARIDLDNWREFANLVLEDSVEIDFEKHAPSSGGRLNNALLAYFSQKDSLYSQIRNKDLLLREKYPDPEEYGQKSTEEWTKYKENISALYENWMRAHPDDGVGEAAWRDGYTDAVLDCNPEMLKRFYALLSPRFKSQLQSAQKGKENIIALENTAAGKPFTDVEGLTTEGKPIRLSDYAGKGKLTVVDFWASWCGPCRQEGRETLKPLWEKYKDKGNLTIVGIAVMDEKSRTLQAIAEEKYEWPQIIDTGDKPMKQYGLIGIPHILLIDADGTIVARGLRGSGIERAVMEQMKKTNNQ